MIKKLLFGALILGAGAITAQNLDLKDDMDNSIDGLTHYIYKDSGGDLSATKFHVSNSSSSDIDFDISVLEVANATAKDLQVCFGTVCFNADDGVSTYQTFSDYTVPASGQYNDSKVAPFAFTWTTGNFAVWKVKVVDGSNASDNSEAYVVWTMGGTFAGDLNNNRVVDAGEIAGDINLNGSIDGGEITGDMNGSWVIDEWEVNGDANGNGIIDNGEVLSLGSIDKTNVSFKVYPNPVIDQVVLNYKVNGTANNVDVIVRDLLGKQVGQYNFKGANGQLKLDAARFDSGLYFFTIVIDNQVMSTEKVIFK